MTIFADRKEAREILGGFLLAFERLDPVLRAAAMGEQLSMKLELTDPELNALVDLKSEPLRVDLDSDDFGDIGMSGRADYFHDLAIGKIAMATAINEKKLVVRGPASKLMKVANLFYLSPYIYPHYLQALGRADLAGGEIVTLHLEPTEVNKMTAIVAKLAWLTGYSLGLVKSRMAKDLDIVRVLEALGKGMNAAEKKP